MPEGGAFLGAATGIISLDVAPAIKALAEMAAAARAAGAETQAALGKVDDAAAKTGASTRLLGAGMAAAGASILGATVLIGKGAVDAASKFQASMELIRTQAGASQQEVDGMSKSVLALSGSVGTGPEELAQALFHIESAGYRGQKAIDALTIAAEGAKVGQANLVDVTNALDAVMVAGGKDAQDLGGSMGELNAIVGAGDMTMQDLANAMSTGIIATAHTFGLSLQDVGAALAVFGDNNIRGADAATKLRQAITLMAAPSGPAIKALARIGISQTELADDMRNGGLISALTDLKQHLQDSGLTATEQAQVISKAFGGGRSGAAIQILLQQLDRLKQKYGDIGAGAKQFGADWEATTQNAAFQSARFHATIDALKVGIGVALLPAVTSLLLAVTPLVATLARWTAAHTALTRDILLGVGAFGALLTAVGVGLVIFPALAAAVGLILGPIGLVVGALALIGVAYKTNFLGFRDAVNAVAGAVASAVGRIVAPLRTMATSFRDAFAFARSINVDPITAAFAGINQAALDVFGANSPITRAARVMQLLSGYLVSIATASSHADWYLSNMTGPLRTVAIGAGFVVAAVRDFIDVLGAHGLGGAIEFLPQTLQSIGQGLQVLAAGLADIPIVGPVVAFVVDDIGRALVAVGQALGPAISAFEDLTAHGVNPVAAALQALGTFIDGFKTGFAPLDKIIADTAAVWRDLGKALNDAINGDWTGALGKLGKAFLDLGKGIGDLALLIPRTLLAAFQAIDWSAVGDALGSGVRAALAGIADLAGDIFAWAVSEFAGVDWGDALTRGVRFAASVGALIAAKLGDIVADIGTWAVKQFVGVDWPGALQAGLALLVGVGALVVTALGSLARDLAGWVKDQFGTIGDTIKGAITDSIGAVKDFGAGVVGAIVAAIGAGVSTIDWGNIPGELVASLWNAMKGAAAQLNPADLFAGGALNQPPVTVGSLLPESPQVTAIRKLLGQSPFDLGNVPIPQPGFVGQVPVQTLLAQIGQIQTSLEATKTTLGDVMAGVAKPPDLSGVVAGFGDAGAQLAAALGAGLQKALTAAVGTRDAIAKAAADLGPPLSAAGATAGGGFAVGLGAGLQRALGAATAVGAAIIGVAEALATGLAAQGQGGGSRFATGLGAGLNLALGATSAVAAAIRGILDALAATAGSDGTLAGSGFALGFGNAGKAAIGYAQDIANGVTTALALNLNDLGFNAGQSFANGLSAAAQGAADAAANIAIAARNAVQSVLGIFSPSRVFQDLANQTVAGFLGPLRSRAGEVAAAMAALVTPPAPQVAWQLAGDAATSQLATLQARIITSAPAQAAPATVVYQTTVINTMKSEEYSKLLTDAERGSAFAIDMTSGRGRAVALGR